MPDDNARRQRWAERLFENRSVQLHRYHASRILILISCSLFLILLTACGSSAGSESGGSGANGWEVVMEDLPAALTSIWGTSASDVWVTGADPEGTGNIVKHFDGNAWTDMATGETGDLWWVYGFEGGSTYFGGADGLILRYADGEFERMETPGDATVYGIWGTSEEDLWAVGGNAVTDAFAWRYDGTAWSEVEGFPPVIANSSSMFKVWGSAPDDVWIVGTGGAILHWDGTRLTQVKSDTTRDLFTVAGNAEFAAAVGGFGTGVIVENAGDGWRDVTPDGIPHVVGVVAGETFYAVGIEGAVLERIDGTWTAVDTGIDTNLALHTVWVDPDGGVWAVGGQVLAPPLEDGIMIRKSARDQGS